MEPCAVLLRSVKHITPCSIYTRSYSATEALAAQSTANRREGFTPSPSSVRASYSPLANQGRGFTQLANSVRAYSSLTNHDRGYSPVTNSVRSHLSNHGRGYSLLTNHSIGFSSLSNQNRAVYPFSESSKFTKKYQSEHSFLANEFFTSFLTNGSRGFHCSTNYNAADHLGSKLKDGRRWSSSLPPSGSADLLDKPGQEGVTLVIEQGLPQLTVPLPSRRELCKFPLRPVSHTVSCLTTMLMEEDKGIDRVLVRTKDGVRISSSARIETLLLTDFDLIINDTIYHVPRCHVSQEGSTELSDIRALVGKLYVMLNVEEQQLEREREIVQTIEGIRDKLAPLEQERLRLVSAAHRRTQLIMYSGLSYMALQFGFLARLTWWEYSWDIMEPVTYFVTYGTAIMATAYYCLTKHEFILPEVHDRQFLLGFYRKAGKSKFSVMEYNELKNKLALLEQDLARLRDPLSLNLPPTHLKIVQEQIAAQHNLSLKPRPLDLLKSMLKNRGS